MSQGASLSRKDKKAQRDAERRNHGKKRKFTETVESDDQDIQASTDTATHPDTDETSAQVVANTESSATSKVDQSLIENPSTSTTAPKTKKRKISTQDGQEARDSTVREASSKSRFILFIGNLPYATTDASLQAHFQKLAPFNLRHRTDPKTKKSKGFAFLEFENYDRMKTCLKLYHHSMFDPAAKENGGSGKGNGKGARRINVELTAGGGGKAESRKEKIKVKNVRLEEQRKRRAETERKEKERQERKDAAAGRQKGNARAPEEASSGDAGDADGIHPSRRARMNVNG